MLTNLKPKLFFSLLTLLILVNGCSDQSTSPNTKNEPVPKMDSLVTTQWLSEHLNDPDLVVLDSSVFIQFDEKGNMSAISGQENFDAGHIPTARFADLKGNLSATHESFEFVMPSPEQFANAIGELGVSNDSRVVIYSAENQTWGARLWWMLRWAGLEQVALLDGGLKAWKAEGRPISTEPSTYSKAQFNLSLNPQMIADRDEVMAAIDNEQVSIVDALFEDHYAGKVSMYARPGHITSATNMPVSELFTPSAHYRPLDELDMQFEGGLEGDRSKRVITYCGGGVAASSTAFTMYRLGYTNVAVYMGSLQEWSINPENPMITE